MKLLIVGGSDAGISAGLRARELDPGMDVMLVVADAYPNFSICGIPYYLSGDVAEWHHLAHRTRSDLEQAGLRLRLNTIARQIDAVDRRVWVDAPDGRPEWLSYDALVLATGAVPVLPPIAGLAGDSALGPDDGVFLLHSIGDARQLMDRVTSRPPRRAVIVGAGYIGLEMAEALVTRGIQVTQLERLPEVLPTVDPALGARVRQELEAHGVDVRVGATVTQIRRMTGGSHAVEVRAAGEAGEIGYAADLVLVVVGVRPDVRLAHAAGATLGPAGTIAVDQAMRTSLPEVWAAGDCVTTFHRLLGPTYLPLGTTAHKQGRVAGENAIGGTSVFAGSLGTQVVKVFDMVIARTGLRDAEARTAGFDPVTVAAEADDHKAYYPGSHRIALRITGDRHTGRLLGVQMFGHRHAEVAKRIDIAAMALFHAMRVADVSDVDLSYTPPLGTPWEALQVGMQAWSQEHPAPD